MSNVTHKMILVLPLEVAAQLDEIVEARRRKAREEALKEGKRMPNPRIGGLSRHGEVLRLIKAGLKSQMASKEIERLEKENADLNAAIAEHLLATPAERDAEDGVRLDWLERKLFERKWCGTLEVPSEYFVRGDFRHTTQRMRGETLREAIDAARKGEGNERARGV